MREGGFYVTQDVASARHYPVLCITHMYLAVFSWSLTLLWSCFCARDATPGQYDRVFRYVCLSRACGCLETHQCVIIIIIIRRNICSAPFTDKIRTAVHYIVSKKNRS